MTGERSLYGYSQRIGTVKEYRMFERIDKIIFFIIITLILLGVIFVFSSSYYFAMNLDVSPYYFSLKQLFWALASIAVFLFFIRFDYRKLKKWVKPLVIVTVVLLVLVFLPMIGKSSGGARRWIDFRLFSVQSVRSGEIYDHHLPFVDPDQETGEAG